MTAKVINRKDHNKDAVEDRKKLNDEKCEDYAKKFGILKKASVLLYYGRPNDAFNEIAKAADRIKKADEKY
jgi:hypothetical protein